jgi:HEAT repeat protein
MALRDEMHPLLALQEVIAKIRRQRRAAFLLRSWQKAAALLGFSAPVREGDDISLSGASEGFAVELRQLAVTDGTRVSVSRSDLATTIVLRRGVSFVPAGYRGLLSTFSGSTLGTGDERFDPLVQLHGDEAQAIALLDSETRHALRYARGLSVSVEGGAVTQHHRALLCSLDEIGTSIDSIKDLARRFLVPEDVAGRLAANARDDPEPGVRARNLEVLARHFPGRAQGPLRAALDDYSDEVRLRAAVALGEEGRETLLGFAQDDASSEDLRVRAVDALGGRLPLAQMSQLLETLLDGGSLMVVLAAIVGFEKSVAEAPPAAVSSAEGALFRVLDHREERVRLAAAQALGRVGSVAAVTPLMAAIQARAFDPGFDDAARRAIAAIQARVPGASVGQLSLTAGAAGQVSLPDDDSAGRVSLPEDK